MTSSSRGSADSRMSSHENPNATTGHIGRRWDENIIVVGDAPFAVVDWRAGSNPDPDELVDVKPHVTTFTDADELSQYIRQPCSLPTSVRLIHTVNAQNPPQPSAVKNDDGNTFDSWASRGARQKAANLGCFAWEPAHFSSYQSRNTLPDSEIWFSEACCSIDYFDLCKHTDMKGSTCLDDKHSLIFAAPDRGDPGSESDCTYTACPRRISTMVHRGPVDILGLEPIQLNPNDPEFVIIVCEDVPHACPAFFGSELSFAINSKVGGRDEWGSKFIAREILQRLFRKLSLNWTTVLKTAVRHSRNLEDCVYTKPDDDSQSPALWAASKSWMTIERLLRAHIAVLGDFAEACAAVGSQPVIRPKVKENSPGPKEERGRYPLLSVRDAIKTMERCLVQVHDDLIKPTTNLLDMLYKSVAIRDARLSLDLNASLWRLSWITFIFLPLTFLSGFFGMNVDLFADDPSIKWYFISAAALVALFFLLWLGIKLAQKRQVSFGRKYKSYRNMV